MDIVEVAGIKFEVYFDGEFLCARGLGQDIFTQGVSLDEIVKNIEEAVTLHLEGTFHD